MHGNAAGKERLGVVDALLLWAPYPEGVVLEGQRRRVGALLGRQRVLAGVYMFVDQASSALSWVEEVGGLVYGSCRVECGE